MEFVNRLGIAATAVPSMAPDGTALTVLVAKATFALPLSGTADRAGPKLLGDQQPIVEVDEFEAEPGLSAPRQEADLAPYKPRCDVLLQGAAYAPGGKSSPSCAVGMRVGAIKKAFEVTGPRCWQRALRPWSAWSLSDAEPFVRQPLSYGMAYGGADNRHADPSRHAVCPTNPVGLGFHSDRDSALVSGRPAPQTQAFNSPPADPWHPQASLSFGPVGRNWQPRLQLAGTFDDAWREQRFPLLPEDFDPLHWQAAPADQRLDALSPGLPVELWNLTPDGHCAFELPGLPLQVRCTRDGQRGGGSGSTSTHTLRADTLLIEPEQGRFSLVWRMHWPLLRSLGTIVRLELRHA